MSIARTIIAGRKRRFLLVFFRTDELLSVFEPIGHHYPPGYASQPTRRYTGCRSRSTVPRRGGDCMGPPVLNPPCPGGSGSKRVNSYHTPCPGKRRWVILCALAVLDTPLPVRRAQEGRILALTLNPLLTIYFASNRFSASRPYHNKLVPLLNNTNLLQCLYH